MPRGRPAQDPHRTPPYPNALNRLLRQRHLTHQQVASRSGLGLSLIGKLARGEQRLRAEHIAALAPAIEVPEEVLLGKESGLAVPIRYRVAAYGAGLERAELEPELPPGFARPARSLADPERLFAAEVADDSADGFGLAKGAVLIARRLAHGEPLALDGRTQYLAAFYRTSLAADDLMEILVGILDWRITGELTLITRSSDRQVPQQPVIRRPTSSKIFVNDTLTAFLHERKTTEQPYSSDAADLGQVLGRVVWAESLR